jgi:hypothetical protein
VEFERARYLAFAGRAALESEWAAARPASVVERASLLRQRYSPGEAAALGEQLSLRERAAGRGLPVDGWLYSAEGQQMMTHPLVASRRASRFALAGRTVADLTCGLGGDLAAIAATGINAVGVERDPATAVLAAANVPAASVVIADAVCAPVRLDRHALLLDPGRRDGGGRRFDPAAFSPPWATCLELAAAAPMAALKTSPGIEERHIPDSAEREYVQLGRTLREATVWLGETARPGLRRAVMLPAAICIDSDAPECDPDPVPIGRYIVDPEGCVTRASLVRHLAAAVGGRLIDPNLAYITTANPRFTPLGTTFEVLEVLPFSLRRLRDLLRARGWRPDEIRRRAFPIEPDQLRRLLKVSSGQPVVLLCTTIAGTRTVGVARRLVDGTAGQ